jgi:hypothetical protein
MEPEIVTSLMKEVDFRIELDSGLVPLMTSIGRWALDQRNRGSEPVPDIRKHLYDEPLRKERPSAVGL